MKIAPSVATLLKGFPKQEHQIDKITGKPERLAIDILIEDIIENAASVATLKGGGLYGHTGTCMSDALYATIPGTIPFIPAPPPGVLAFGVGDTQATRDDTKILFYNGVHDFELGAFSELDKRLTRYDDGRTTKMYGNQNYCHTHGWDNVPSHDSTNCSYLESFTMSQQLPTTPRMDVTCTNVSPTEPEGVGSMTNRTII